MPTTKWSPTGYGYSSKTRQSTPTVLSIEFRLLWASFTTKRAVNIDVRRHALFNVRVVK